MSFKECTYKKFYFYLNVVLGGICFCGIFLYPLQGLIISFLPSSAFQSFWRNGRIRYLGIGLHPTSTGFLILYYIGYLFFVKKDMIQTILHGIFLFLSGTRSALFGLPGYIFIKQKPRTIKIFLLIGILLIFVLYTLVMNDTFSKYLDGSAIAHLNHLLVLGPATVINYPWGAGLGMVSPYNTENPIIHLESEMYLYMIQLGFVLFGLKIFFYIKVIITLLRVNTKYTRYLLFILMTYLLGCMIFPLNNTRFISNFIWVIMGVEYSRIRKNNRAVVRRHI